MTLQRFEIVIVCFALSVALFARVRLPTHIAVEHFDEGVYASNIWFGEKSGHRYPLRHLYAPPLLPVVIETSMLAGGAESFVAIMPSIVFGMLTVIMVWRMLRRWFGIDVGIAGVVFAATSSFHIAYCRTALTDVTLGCFLLAAVGLGVNAIARGGALRILGAGIVTGLAWWTKYNGWLPLAILFAASAAWLLFLRTRPVHPLRALLRWLGIAHVAVLVWLPVPFSLQKFGGYAAVARNHRQYLNELSGWPVAAAQHVFTHRHFDGWLSWLGVLAAILLALFVFHSSTWNRVESVSRINAGHGRKQLAAILVLISLSVAVSTSVALGLVALVGLSGSIVWPIWQSGEAKSKRDRHSTLETSLAIWAIAAWIVGLTATTPLYRPYPRLTIPWLIAAWMGASVGIGWWLRANRNVTSLRPDSRETSLSRKGLGAVVAICVLLVWFDRHQMTHAGNTPTWQDRTALSRIAQQIRDDVSTETTNPVVLTIGEPALFFHLQRLGIAAAPVVSSNVAVTNGPGTFVVVGPQAIRDGNVPREADSELERVGSYHYVPSDIVALNDKSWSNALRKGESPKSEVLLYRSRVAAVQ